MRSFLAAFLLVYAAPEPGLAGPKEECLQENKLEVCQKIGLNYLDWQTEKHTDTAKRYLRRACEIQLGRRCSNADAYATTQALLRSEERKAAIRRKAKKKELAMMNAPCGSLNPQACLYSGLQSLKSDKTKAKEFFSAGCRFGDKESCEMLKNADNARIQVAEFTLDKKSRTFNRKPASK